jgi:hypothetical protein
MITDKTLDEALVEIMRTKKALEALRKARKLGNDDRLPVAEHAAAKRASLDLTRKLAALRAGR